MICPFALISGGRPDHTAIAMIYQMRAQKFFNPLHESSIRENIFAHFWKVSAPSGLISAGVGCMVRA